MGSEPAETAASTSSASAATAETSRGGQRQPADPTAAIDEQYNCSFSAEQNARYHAARRGFYESVYRWILFAIIAAGTAGVFNLATAWAGGAAALAGLTAVLSAINLAFDPAGKARLHENLQRKSFEMMAEIDGTVDAGLADYAKWKAAAHRLGGEEPPPRRALQALAYNATIASRRENPEPDMLVVTFWQRLWKQIAPFTNAHFPRRRELDVAATKTAHG
jgi:hypothetical protein